MKTILALLAAFPFAVVAQTFNDDLWEVKSTMNMPGMPAGMGGQTQQVCAEKGDVKKTMQRKGSEKCKMTDFKQSGNKVTMTMECPEGTAVIENTFNAARTEYNGTMKMTSKHGDMNMTMSGRKIGTCDAKQQRAEAQQTMATMKDQIASMQAQNTAMVAKSQSQEIAHCQEAVDTMQMDKLGMYGRCDTGNYCQQMLASEHTKPVATKCMASQAEFCKRYQTMDGFAKAKGDERAAKMCKVSRDQVIGRNCSQAAQTEHLPFLAQFCPAEAKPVAKAHCVGFDYTSKAKTKYSDFCRTYLANNELDEPKPAAASVKSDPKSAVQQGVSSGINKIKGLFGK